MLWFATGIAALSLPLFWFGIGGTFEAACDSDGACGMGIDRLAMLPDEIAAGVRASARDAAAFDAYVHRPAVRALLTVLVTIRILPFVALFACAAIALRQLGTCRGDALAHAFPWLKRAGIAAACLAVMMPLIDTVRGAVASLGVPGIDAPQFHLDIDSTTMGLNLLLALTMLSVAWALEAGTRAARDMDEFV